jgi:uncharacterized membrane protein
MAQCTNCGSAVEGKFCPKCGTPLAGGAGIPTGAPINNPGTPAAAGMADNMAAALCYLLGLVTGILFLVLQPYNQNRTIRFHAFQSIFFHVGMIVVFIVFSVVAAIIGRIPILGWMIDILGWMVISLGALVVWLMLMFKAYNNERLVLPVIGPLAEKQA